METSDFAAVFRTFRPLGKGEVVGSCPTGSTTSTHCKLSKTFHASSKEGGGTSRNCLVSRPIVLTENDKARFWGKVKKRTDSECWLWIAGTNIKGYGRFKVGKRFESAHRVSWVLANGQVPPGHGYHGTIIMHRCDNPRCCNPAHLMAGSAQDNVQDMLAKGRHGARLAPHNAAHYDMIVSDPRGIRLLSAATGIPQSTIARLRRKAGRAPNAFNPGQMTKERYAQNITNSHPGGDQ